MHNKIPSPPPGEGQGEGGCLIIEKEKITYVLDFDGTVTMSDISTKLSRHFGGRACMILEESYRQGEIGIKGWLMEASTFLPADPELLLSFALERAALRPGFREFLEFARKRNRPVSIASDGFGFYIEPVLDQFGCLPYITRIYNNRLVAGGNGFMTGVTPHANGNCDICSNCKAGHVAKLHEEGRRVIYAGDGSNDRFAASRADLVFARADLAEILAGKGIPFIQWRDFHDLVTDTLPVCGIKTRPLCEPCISGEPSL